MYYSIFKEVSGHFRKSIKVYISILEMNCSIGAMTCDIYYRMILKLSLR